MENFEAKLCWVNGPAEPSGMLTSQFGGSHIGLLGRGASAEMRTRNLLLVGLAFVTVFAVGVRGDAAEELGQRESTLKTGTRRTAAFEAK